MDVIQKRAEVRDMEALRAWLTTSRFESNKFNDANYHTLRPKPIRMREGVVRHGKGGT